ncbi:MAG: hypothetical protein OIF32_09790 [Campylobacterales bacterium]|nr:hypothetical protein [Campylobacterales bacterium]
MTILLHQIFATIFGGFILIDRFVIRKFLEKEKREKIYTKVKYLLLFCVVVLIFTGGYLSYQIGLYPIIVIKGFIACLVIFMFFNCPYFMKRAKCETCKKIYRSLVTLFLLVVVFLGITI